MPTTEDYLRQLQQDKANLTMSLEDKGIEVTGNETFTELATIVGGIPVSDPSEYFNNNFKQGTSSFPGVCYGLKKVNVLGRPSSSLSMTYMFYKCENLEEVVMSADTSNNTSMANMFYNCTSLIKAPTMNTSNVTAMGSAFYGCRALRDVPVYNTSKVTQWGGMFTGCQNLSDESINNILTMCINATSFAGTKTLAKAMGFSSSYISQAKIESMPNYQDFLNAGWTIGY